MSQRLAEERKAAEETKKFYNEDLPDEDMAEEEAEFTDPDTSDHEFLQNEAEEKEGESDACSDLDEDERVGKMGTVGESGEGVGGEGGEGGKGEERSEGGRGEEEDDGYSGGDESESDECFSDNETIHLTNRSSKKKQRLLDSDEEGEKGEGGDVISPPKRKALVSDKPRKSRLPSGGIEEGSMGPLALFEDSNENQSEPVDGRQGSGLDAVEMSGNMELSGVGLRPDVEREKEQEEEVEIGMEERLGEDSRPGQSEDLDEEDVVPTLAIPDSDRDNSLENSYLWAPSLPAAQPWNDNTTTCASEPPGGEGGVSQWAGFSQRHRETQNTSLDEETQFLDANGWVRILAFHQD